MESIHAIVGFFSSRHDLALLGTDTRLPWASSALQSVAEQRRLHAVLGSLIVRA